MASLLIQLLARSFVPRFCISWFAVNLRQSLSHSLLALGCVSRWREPIRLSLLLKEDKIKGRRKKINSLMTWQSSFPTQLFAFTSQSKTKQNKEKRGKLVGRRNSTNILYPKALLQILGGGLMWKDINRLNIVRRFRYFCYGRHISTKRRDGSTENADSRHRVTIDMWIWPVFVIKFL